MDSECIARNFSFGTSVFIDVARETLLFRTKIQMAAQNDVDRLLYLSIRTVARLENVAPPPKELSTTDRLWHMMHQIILNFPVNGDNAIRQRFETLRQEHDGEELKNSATLKARIGNLLSEAETHFRTLWNRDEQQRYNEALMNERERLRMEHTFALQEMEANLLRTIAFCGSAETRPFITAAENNVRRTSTNMMENLPVIPQQDETVRNLEERIRVLEREREELQKQLEAKK